MCKPAFPFTFSGTRSSPPRGLAPACGGVVLSGGCVNHSGFEAFLAIELDVLSKTPNMSRASRIHEDHLLAGLVRLWAYAFREKRADLHQDEVRGCFATEESVLPVLVTFGFLDQEKGHCFRVRGAEKYLRISAARSAGGKASAGNLKRGTQPGTSRGSAEVQPESPPNETLTPVSDPRLPPGSIPAPPNTEHRTPVKKKNLLRGLSSAVRWCTTRPTRRRAQGGSLKTSSGGFRCADRRPASSARSGLG